MRLLKPKTAIAACALVLSFVAQVVAETWDMPTAYSGLNYQTQTAQAFAKCVATGTGDAITIAVHPGGSLFKGTDIKRAVQTGQVQIGERLLSAHQNENPLFGMDSVPFLATNFEDAEKLWQVIKPTYHRILKEQNLVLLYSVSWPPQGMYFKEEVTRVDQLKGKRFRATNNTTIRMAQLTGMSPVMIEMVEIGPAFATGVVETMISSGASGYDTHIWDSLTHFYELNFSLPRNYVIINQQVWDATPTHHQNVIKGCAGLAEYAGNWRTREYTTLTLNGLRAGGMSVTPPDPGFEQELCEVGQILIDEWLEETGDEGVDLINQFQNLP